MKTRFQIAFLEFTGRRIGSWVTYGNTYSSYGEARCFVCEFAGDLERYVIQPVEVA